MLPDTGVRDASRIWVLCCKCIVIEDVEGAICKMHRGRAVGPDKISVEFWRTTGVVGMEWLTKLFNVVFKTAQCSRSGGGVQ